MSKIDNAKSYTENNRNKVSDTTGNSLLKKADSVIDLKVRLFIGILLIVAAFVTDAAVGFAESYNHIVTLIMVIGFLCVVNVIFIKALKNPVPFIPFMTGNVAGMLIYMFIISCFEQIGEVYMILFLVICFLAMLIMQICLITGAFLKKRIIGGILMNLSVLIVVALSSFVTIFISLINQ